MWQLAASRASLSLGPISGLVDVAHPELGLKQVQINGLPWPNASILRVVWPTPPSHGPVRPAEVYVRGADLVANYEPFLPYTVEPQIYWRARQAAADRAWGIELVLSVQTTQLYSEPLTPIFSRLAEIQGITSWSGDGSTRRIAADQLPCTLKAAEGARGLVGFEPVAGDVVYVQWIHPTDFHAFQIDSDGDGVLVATQVFQEHLEKGVIRRARLCGWFLPRAEWQSVAARLYDDYCQEPPPLTA